MITEYGLGILLEFELTALSHEAFHSQNDINDFHSTIYDSRDVITNWPAQYSKQNSQYLGLAFKATSQMIQLQCVCSESSNIH